MKKELRVLLLAALAAATCSAAAQSWPTRPIRVIVSFAPGSAPDIVCRFVTDRLSRALGGLGFFTEGAETPEAVGEAIRADREKWGWIVKEIGIQPE